MSSSFHPFFFTDPATTEIYTLSLHDALPIFQEALGRAVSFIDFIATAAERDGKLATPEGKTETDRKSTRLNSSHVAISYAVFCLKKKNNKSVFKSYTIPNHYQIRTKLARHII